MKDQIALGVVIHIFQRVAHRRRGAGPEADRSDAQCARVEILGGQDGNRECAPGAGIDRVNAAARPDIDVGVNNNRPDAPVMYRSGVKKANEIIVRSLLSFVQREYIGVSFRVG